MCGIAGIIDLSQTRPIPVGILQRMADAIIHRGPDEDGFLEDAGIGLANRRLSIVGLLDGKQPICNEDRSIVTVFNGELFDYPEVKARLEARGHRFRTHCDTEIIPHLWEEHQEGMFEHLKGQFAIALWDRKRHCMILARDRFGICPLYYSTQKYAGGDWLLFGSEIKALLASGLVEAKADLRGIDQAFNFLSIPGPATCFAGVTALQPGQYLRIPLPAQGQNVQLERKYFWRIDFPDQGQEDYGSDPKALVDEFERVLLGAVERRLRADVPVVSYLSGGIDSSIIVAMAAKIRGTPIPTFTIQIKDPKFDETSQAAVVSRHIGSTPVVVPVGNEQILQSYPELIRAAEAPVIDTSCAAVLRLARSVHQHGYKVALTGEGADEWLAGYVWFKINRLLNMFDWLPGLKPSYLMRRIMVWVMDGPPGTSRAMSKVHKTVRTYSAFQELYAVMGGSRLRYFAPETLEQLKDYSPYLELDPNFDRIERWHPINRAAFWAGRIHLPGHLLALKGDRVAMNSSVETRYPFLDEEVYSFLARIHPRWKLRSFREKYLLRLLGERYLPREVAWRPKGMFRAPLDCFFDPQAPKFVDQLLSEESLRKTGYFNIPAVQFFREKIRNRQVKGARKPGVELGLAAVVATQLWHHTFIDNSLADLESHVSTYPPKLA
jgi:asparagine synthase (glutamine-hydrolysing)